MNRSDLILLSTILGFALLNFITLVEFDHIYDRWVRVVGTCFITGIYLIGNPKRRKTDLLVFALLILADLALLQYESELSKIIQFTMRGSAYLLIGKMVIGKIKNFRIPVVQKWSFILILLFNLYLLYIVAETFKDQIETNFILAFFYYQGVAALIMLFLATAFLTKNGKKKSLFFFFAACSFLLSDLSAFSAYHLDFREFYFLDRGLYLLGLGGLIKFLNIKKLEKPQRTIF